MQTQTTKKTRGRKPLSKSEAIKKITSLNPCTSGQVYLEKSKARTFKGLFEGAETSYKNWLIDQLMDCDLLKRPEHHNDAMSTCPGCKWIDTLCADVNKIEAALRKVKAE